LDTGILFKKHLSTQTIKRSRITLLFLSVF
jgi:hypothetical protein